MDREDTVSDTATIAEVSLRETVTWTMPRAIYDLVAPIMETWQFIHGRHPRATVDRALRLLEWAIPDIREEVTCERRANPPPAIRGHKADVSIRDDWVYRRWIEGANAGWSNIDTPSQPREGQGS
jgi:hypothetical protein